VEDTVAILIHILLGNQVDLVVAVAHIQVLEVLEAQALVIHSQAQ
tara:strand:+ start:102 stop:236 length:135 start_codon:yes stop_codon:yes gene_type:complete